MLDEETMEIRCLWQRTDYGHVSLEAAARGYDGRELGSYQDCATDEMFAAIRADRATAEPEWRLVESVLKVPAAAVEALFTDRTEIEVESDA